MNRPLSTAALAIGLFFYVGSSAAGESFTGTWIVDLRTPAERQRGTGCGTAEFVLTQAGEVITGTHAMAVAGCGRLNEQGPVKGVIVGSTAVLVVNERTKRRDSNGYSQAREGKAAMALERGHLRRQSRGRFAIDTWSRLFDAHAIKKEPRFWRAGCGHLRRFTPTAQRE